MSTQQDWSKGWQERLPTSSLQAEFFAMKFPDVTKQAVFDLKKDFDKFDSRGFGEIQEDEAMRLLEFRKETKRYVELRQMVKDMDYDKNRELSLMEMCCASFGKSWKQLHTPSADQADIEARLNKIRELQHKEIETAKAAHLAAEKEKAKMEERRLKEEAEQKKRDEELSKAGIKGSAAKFQYMASDTADKTWDNAAKIKEDARLRKEKKDAEAAAKKAEDERKKAEEEKERVEREAKEAEKKKADELKAKLEEEARIAEQKEKERKEKVQAALAAKFKKN